MRLRNRNIPQAGTGAKSNGESRPGPSGSGCPSYSGGDDVPHKDDNPLNNILLHRDSSSSRLSQISSLFSSLPSSPASYLNANISRSTSSSSLSIESAVDVVQEAIPAIITAPAHSKECKRKKWSKSMNIFIMHQYFILTKLETDTKSYLTQLHILFTSRFPEMDASKQRVGDQRRAIVQRQLLSRQEILDIKNDVKKTLHNQSEQFTNGQDQTELSNNDTDCILRRMRWTTNINEKIMRAYYRITKLETDLTTYRPLLHQQITATCPSIAHLSIQRIADQRRSIVSNHLLSRAQLKKIRDEVQMELDILTPETTDYTEQQTDKTPRQSDVNGVQSSLDDITSLPPEQNHLINSTPIQNREPAKLSIKLETQLKEMFIEANNTFQNISPTARLTLPKLKPSKKLYQISDSLNSKIIPSMIDDDTDFNTLHTYIYTAAYTATKFSGVRINVNNTTNSNKTQPTPWWQKRLENRISGLRASIGRLTEYTRGVRSTYLDNHIQKIKQQYKVHYST